MTDKPFGSSPVTKDEVIAHRDEVKAGKRKVKKELKLDLDYLIRTYIGDKENIHAEISYDDYGDMSLIISWEEKE